MTISPVVRRAVLLISLMTLVGCTELVTYQLVDDASQVPPAAFPYALSKTRITTTFTVTLVNCDPAKDSAYPSLNLKVAAVTAQAFEADPSERYYVDYTQLSTFWKSTALKVTTAGDETLQGINTESNDQTLQISGAFLQTAASIAGAALTGAVHVRTEQPVAQQNQYDAQYYANPDAQHNFPENNARQPTHPKPEYISACSGDARAAVDNLVAKKRTLQDAQAKTKGAGSASAPSVASDAALSQAANDVADAEKAVTLTIPMTVEPIIADFRGADGNSFVEHHLYSADLLKYIRSKWVDKSRRDGWIDVSYNGSVPLTEASASDKYVRAAKASVANGGSDLVPVADDISFELSIRRFWLSAAPANTSTKGSAATATSGGTVQHDGLVVRQPAIGYFRTCLGACQPPDEYGVVAPDPNGTNLDLEPQVQVSVPQLGKKLELPLHNGFGQDMSLGLTLGPDGSMNVLSFQDNSTIGAGLTAVGNAGTAYTNAMTARNGAITARNGAITAQEGLATSAEQIAVGYAGLATTNASYADNALKAQADCIQQAQTIVKNGRSPTVQCPGGQ
ncbi:hypothetical protein [Paraburkholderia bannensis]|uniref:hypothetical protein n=1 Tax=Paraburkholderia bannensis TaxID=765414 RepID=UPI002AC33B73|nr:hypothetical protein [Paraburkholderia bannensis]